ncbi:YeiH family protein [Helicobacter mesocricetorum]|uniref:YeiH family protein n=1 Tax=Helicobacter mesocricetorum TaxID=87012 RepID=UPI000CF07F87|nr:putative sulfate exporter family transporter [Helicobacter mesocricetorum]
MDSLKAFFTHNIQGLLLIGVIVALSTYLSSIPAIHNTTHLAPTAIAILIGVCLSSLFFKYQQIFADGVHFSAKKLLKLGIILYGFFITFNELRNVGLLGLIAAFVIVISIFLIALLIGTKALKLDKEISMLIGAGSAICGAAAILALEQTLKSDSFKGIIAISCIVIFGLMGMFLYPIAFYSDLIPNLNENSMGFFIGATLHEVANVVGATEIAKDMGGFSQEAANTAIIIKMIRVIMLVPFLFFMAYYATKHTQSTTKTIQIPYFAFLFIGTIILHTFLHPYKATHILGTITIQSLINSLQFSSVLCIVAAMAALGLQIHFKKLIETSKNAFVLGAILFAFLILGGYFLSLLFQSLF